jgi:hypothetical protein
MRFFPRAFVLGCCLNFLPALALAQEAPEPPYQVPQTVFVGDDGTLVVPLGAGFAGAAAMVLEGPGLPQIPDLVISRIELENRGGKPRLLIGFRAYVPGAIPLPPLVIGSWTFGDLELHIASILEAGGDSLVLSPLAPSLAVPGTLGIIYGAVLGILLLILALVAFSVWGIPALKGYGERSRRRRLLRSMGKVLKQLRNNLGKGPAGEGEVIAALSRELRVLLGLFTGMHCRAMVPGEFLGIPPLAEGYSGEFLRDLFLRCDTQRFSGQGIPREEALDLLDRVRAFTGAMAQGAA